MLVLVIVTSARQPSTTTGTDAGEVLGGGVGATASTGATATTGTSGTTGTTGATAGDGNLQGVGNIVLMKVEEKLHVPSGYLSGGNITTTTDRHAVRLKLKCPYFTSTSNNYPITTYTMTYASEIAVPTGSEIGSDTTLPSVTSSSIHVDGTPANQTVQCAVVKGPTGFNAATWYAWPQRGNTATLTSPALTSGTINIYVRYVTYMSTYNQITEASTEVSGDKWIDHSLAVDKLALTSISLDSRRVYGKANLDGELPGDPNADLTTNVFKPWIFHGGHFTGNMPYATSKDQSGLARTQLQLTTMANATTYIASCLTAYGAGTRGSFSAGTIGLFRPAANDSKLSYGDDANWDNRWTLEPGGTQTGPGDFLRAPFYTVTPVTADQGNYMNWQMPSVSNVWRTEYGGTGNMADNQMWKYYGLCQTNETTTTWQYFGSPWIETVAGQMFPLTDSRPRVWKVRYP